MHNANALERQGAALDTALPGNASSIGTTLGTSFAAVWRQVRDWRQRAHSRRYLPTMNERMLRDIGVTCAQARREAAKWFWQE